MYYPLDDLAEPGVFVLQDGDRFHAILHSGEIPLADGTTMVLVIFVVRRTSGTHDMFIVNKFFRADTTVNRTLMSKKEISSSDIEQTLATTAATFARTLQSAKGPAIRWNELDLRRIDGKDAQIAAIKKWGKLRSVRVKTD
ncbi:MAG: hypothetical protein ABSH14_01575 [Verrucomicrobiia bacterium]|jgi:hypothetical protein